MMNYGCVTLMGAKCRASKMLPAENYAQFRCTVLIRVDKEENLPLDLPSFNALFSVSATTSMRWMLALIVIWTVALAADVSDSLAKKSCSCLRSASASFTITTSFRTVRSSRISSSFHRWPSNAQIICESLKVWYENGMGPDAPYTVCVGQEDPNCSATKYDF